MKFFTNLKLSVPKLNASVSKFLVSFLLLFSLAATVKAQDINTLLQVIPPYSASLKDYANVTNARFTGFISCITCNNVELTPKRIKLRLIISKENTVIAYSNDIVTSEPVMTLQNGASLTLGLELNNYFKFENLQGISADNYNHLLDDGSYTINFQVLDYLTSAKMGTLTTSISITTNDTPVLIAPRNGENIQVTTNTTIPFSWSAPISQSGFQTNYEYTLVGIADELGDINQQFLNTTPIKTTTTNIPNLTIDAVQSQLVPAKTYAWRVHAIANSNSVPFSLFKNDGYSEIFTFKYNGACAIPTGLQVQAKAADQINVSWSPSTVHYQFRVAYRKYSTTQNNQWVEQTTTNNFLNLTALEPNTTYEIKLGGVCGTNLVSYTAPLQATTLAAGVVNGVACGQQPTIGTLSQTPLATLFINDTIRAGDFTVTITRVSGSNGNFTGEGWIKVPWLADTKIAVKFTNITVNTDKKLIGGYIETNYVPAQFNSIDLDRLGTTLQSALSQLLNLAFGDPNYNATLEKFRVELNKIFDEQIKSDINKLLDQLKSLNDQYNAAVQQYNNATTDADRNTAKAIIDNINSQKNDIASKLKDLQKQASSGPKELTTDEENILKLALTQIRGRYPSATITQLKQQLDAVEKDYDNLITTERAKYVSSTSTQDITLTSQIVYVGNFTIQAAPPSNSVGFNYTTAEKNYNRAQILRTFSKESLVSTDLRLIASIVKVGNLPFKDYVQQQKTANTAIPSQVNAVDAAIEALVDGILSEKFYK